MTTAKKRPNRSRARTVVPPAPPPAHEWEQQPGETALAFETFCIYRDLPPGDRSHAKVVAARNARYPERRAIGVTEAERLSKNWRWPARVRLWDAMIAEKARDGEIEAAVTARRRHLAIAEKLLTLSDKHLDRLISTVETGAVILTRDVIRAADTGVRISRLVRGESTENQAQIATTFAELAQESEMVLKGETVNSKPHEYDDL